MLLHRDEGTMPNGEAAEGLYSSPVGVLSPTLAVDGKSLAAFELKFLMPEAQARDLEDRLRRHLRPDPHGDPALRGAYLLSSLYFDTPELAIFHRQPGHRRHKFRLRRYGDEAKVYLERKSKKAGRVRKRRIVAPADDTLGWLAHPEPNTEFADAAWFHRQFALRQLRPVCRLTYRRTAWVGWGDHGGVRVTVDRDVRAGANTDLSPTAPPGILLLSEQAVVEFKFLVAPPLLFKDLIAEMKLTPSRCSKYRLGMQAVGLAASPAVEAGNA